MTCRHDDPINNKACTSYETPRKQAQALRRQLAAVLKKIPKSDKDQEGACEAMICHHTKNDPDCSGNGGGYSRSSSNSDEVDKLKAQHAAELAALRSTTPDPSQYDIVDAAEVNGHLVLKVLYPNCAKCSFEGHKVMVFLECTSLQAMKWRNIDPHFRADVSGRFEGEMKRTAPSPAARFPATAEGWADAIKYAERKSRKDSRTVTALESALEATGLTTR